MFNRQIPSGQEQVRDLLLHVMHGNEAMAKALLQATPTLALIKGTIGHYTEISAFQLGWMLGDINLCKIMVTALATSPESSNQIRIQITDIAPRVLSKKAAFRNDYHSPFAYIVSKIGFAKNNEVKAELIRHRNPSHTPTKLSIAMDEFRFACDAHGEFTLIDLMNAFIEMKQVSYTTYDTNEKFILCFRQIIGYVQRKLALCHQQALFQGLRSRVRSQNDVIEPLNRIDEWNVHGEMYSLVNPTRCKGLGFDFAFDERSASIDSCMETRCADWIKEFYLELELEFIHLAATLRQSPADRSAERLTQLFAAARTNNRAMIDNYINDTTHDDDYYAHLTRAAEIAHAENHYDLAAALVELISDINHRDLQVPPHSQHANQAQTNDLFANAPTPLSCQIETGMFTDPVTISSGHTLNRSALIKLMTNKLNCPCPFSREIISRAQLNNSPNSCISSYIDKYIISNGKPKLTEIETLLTCPLSKKLFTNPVTLSCGLTIDRDEIVKLLDKNSSITTIISEREVTIDEADLARKPTFAIMELVKMYLAEMKADEQHKSQEIAHSPSLTREQVIAARLRVFTPVASSLASNAYAQENLKFKNS